MLVLVELDYVVWFVVLLFRDGKVLFYLLVWFCVVVVALVLLDN